jgi:hypothetical protein
MSQPDDIDKLLREIDAMNRAPGSGAVEPRAAAAPAPRAQGKPAKAESSGSAGGRLAWTAVSAVGAGVTGGVLGTVLSILPAVSTVSTAVGAAVGGALVAFVSGPPRWFDQE